MNSRSLSLSDRIAQRKDYFADEMGIISAVIDRAIRPFKPGLTIFNMNVVDDHVDVEVSIHILRKYPFKHRFSILEVADNYLSFAEQVAILVEQHFTNLPRINPEDHIILGTD